MEKGPYRTFKIKNINIEKFKNSMERFNGRLETVEVKLG